MAKHIKHNVYFFHVQCRFTLLNFADHGQGNTGSLGKLLLREMNFPSPLFDKFTQSFHYMFLDIKRYKYNKLYAIKYNYDKIV